MTNYREILSLKSQGLSQRSIAKALLVIFNSLLQVNTLIEGVPTELIHIHIAVNDANRYFGSNSVDALAFPLTIGEYEIG